MTSIEQKGIYKRRSSTLLSGIHVELTYIINKALLVGLRPSPTIHTHTHRL
jgi:hypothetical protein